MTDWAAVRREFPAVSSCTYLNTAAGAPISRGAAAAGRDYYETTARDGDVHWDEWLARVERVRAAAAGFVGAQPGDVAFVQNSSHGVNLAARMLAGAGGVLVVGGEFPSVTWPWMQQGFDTRFVPPRADGGVTVADLDAARVDDTGVVALGLVHYRTGYRYRLEELGAWCRDRGLALVVDATQALGAVAVDLAAGDVDFLVSSGYKWLTAGYGVGILYVNPRHQDPQRFAAVGWRSAREPYALRAETLDVARAARVLEAGHPPFPAVFSLGAALELLDGIGASVIEGRVLELVERLATGILDLGIGLESPSDPAHRSGILAVQVDDPAAVCARLADDGVLVSARGSTLRVSAHLYNDETDVARFLECLARRVGGVAGR